MIIKIFIRIQWYSYIALNRNKKLLSFSNKNFFNTHFQWNGLFKSNQHLFDGILSINGCRWCVSRVELKIVWEDDENAASIAAFICVIFRGIYVICYFDFCYSNVSPSELKIVWNASERAAFIRVIFHLIYIKLFWLLLFRRVTKQTRLVGSNKIFLFLFFNVSYASLFHECDSY